MSDLWDEATSFSALCRAAARAALGKAHQPEVEREEILAWHERLAAFLAAELGLCFSERGTRILPTRDGVPFLGWRVYARVIRLSQARWRRFRARFTATEDDLTFSTYRLRRRYMAPGAPGSGMGRERLRPEGPGPRTWTPCPGVDQAHVLRPAREDRTESSRSGGGLHRGVVAGPFFSSSASWRE